MISLEEYAKVCTLISSCNDIINGKFILADYKIANILKNITASKEIYNLLANCLNNFDFEREFSRAQLRSASKPNKFVLPTEPDKVLPFVFCVLVNINNKNIDFDLFLKEFYKSDTNNHAEEYSRFAKEVIMPFRDLIAKHFEVPLDGVPTMKVQVLKKQEEEVDKMESIEKLATLAEEVELAPEEEKDYAELTAEKVEQFLLEIKSICGEILSEMSYDRRIRPEIQDDIKYIMDTIIYNCENGDLKNTIALIISFEYIAQKIKSLKFLTHELKKVLINFYEI